MHTFPSVRLKQLPADTQFIVPINDFQFLNLDIPLGKQSKAFTNVQSVIVSKKTAIHVKDDLDSNVQRGQYNSLPGTGNT